MEATAIINEITPLLDWRGLPLDMASLTALAMGLGWASGLRLYALVFTLGVLGRFFAVQLPGGLDVLMHPLVLGVSGLLMLAEFLLDKVPYVDSVWDTIHSFIRIPAGAALVGMMFSDGPAAVTGAAAILGGAVAAGTHFTKAGTRSAINLSPEPFSNWAASLTEDALVPAGLWLAVVHPVAFLVLLAAGTLCAILLLRWIVGGIKALAAQLRG